MKSLLKFLNMECENCWSELSKSLINNKGYEHIRRQKTIKDINKMFSDEEFLSIKEKEVKSYVL